MSPAEALSSYQMGEEILKDSSRLWKGYLFELYVQNLLLKFGISFIGNSRCFDTWKRQTNKGYDIKVKVGEGSWLQVECKFTLKKIYPSWIRRDWLSRDCDIIVCNDPSKLSEQDRELLESRGIKLLTPSQFILYVLNLIL